MKHIFIVGARGYHANYGGWETFVSKLVDNYDNKNTIFHISMITDNKSMNEYNVSDNIVVNPIYVKSKKNIKMFIYSIKAFNFYLNYVRNNKINDGIIYVLGLKLFNYLWLKKNEVKRLGIKVYVNPDGLEWKRSKWSYPIKKFFLISEKLMLNNCDIIVCDGLGIEKYVHDKYPNLKDKTVYIAYGYDEFDFNGVNEKIILDEFNLKKDDYILIVGRCVPENNYELIIKDFMNSNINKKLVLITNLSSSNYYYELKNKTHFDSDKRIIFIDGIYDDLKLAVIRKNAYAYIHGHSVGGTNPSLIEALSLTDLNILYDVCFNRDIGVDSCLYFYDEGSLTKILNDSSLLDLNRKKLGVKAKKIVKDDFTWKKIISRYKKIFK